GLHNLVIAAVFFLRVSEAVGADLGAVLQDDIVPNPAKLTHGDMRVSLEVVPDARPARDVDEWMNGAMLSNVHVVFDDDIRADRSAFADSCRSSYPRTRIHAAGRLRRLIKKLDGVGKRQIWISASQRRG